MKKLFLFVALMLAFVVSSAQAQDMLKYVPSDTDFVITVNFKQLLSDPSVKQAIEESLSKNEKDKKNYEEFKAATGIDIYKDVDSAVVFSAGKTEANVEKQMAGAIINGNFNKDKIIENAKKDEKVAKDVEFGKVEGFDAFIPKDHKEGYGLFIDNKTIAVGSSEGVNNIAKVAKGTAKNISSRKDFTEALKKLNFGATVSGVGLVTPELKKLIQSNPNAEPFAGVKCFYFDFTKNDNISFNLTGEVEDEKSRDTVATVLNSYLVMLKSFAAGTPEADAVVKQLTVTTGKLDVKLSFHITKAQIESLKKAFGDPNGGNAPAEGKEGREK